MKIQKCPRCNKNRFNNSPYSYTWWSVAGIGRMCYKCYDIYARKTAKQKGKN